MFNGMRIDFCGETTEWLFWNSANKFEELSPFQMGKSTTRRQQSADIYGAIQFIQDLDTDDVYSYVSFVCD